MRAIAKERFGGRAGILIYVHSREHSQSCPSFHQVLLWGLIQRVISLIDPILRVVHGLACLQQLLLIASKPV